MNFIQLDLKKLIIGLVIVGIPLLTINITPSSNQSHWYLKPLFIITGFVQNSYFAFSQGIQKTTSLYVNLIDIKQSNRELSTENTELKTRLTILKEAQQEIQRLNILLGFKSKSPMELLSSKVIARDLISDHSTISIDKGSINNIKKNQAVIGVNGVVGYIFRVGLNTSQVLLLTDRYSVIDGIVQRTRVQGFVEGVSKNSCQLQHIERASDVAKDDIIVTSGLNKVFPKGIPIGTVKRVYTTNFGTSFTAQLEPIIQSNKLEEVFVIQKINQLEEIKKKEALKNEE